MVRFLELIDIYGTPLNFTILGNSFHKTVIGGVFTLITILFLVVCFINSGKDFYLRENPNFIYQKFTNSKYSKVNFSNENMFFAARIEDNDGNGIDLSSYFNISLIYTQREESYYKTTTLPLMNCMNYDYQKLRFQDGFDQRISMGLNCFDLSNVTLGGNWEIDYTYYLTLSLTPCMNSTTIICNDPTLIFDKYSTGLFLNIYSNYYYTDLQDFINPLKISFKNFDTKIDPEISKIFSYYMMEASIKTDLGILFNNPKNYSVYGFDNIVSDYHINNKDQKFILYFMYNIYLGKQMESFQVTYVKLQDIFATLGGIMKLTLIFFGISSDYLSENEKSLSIINQIFDFSSFSDEAKIDNIIEAKEKKNEERVEVKKKIRRNILEF